METYGSRETRRKAEKHKEAYGSIRKRMEAGIPDERLRNIWKHMDYVAVSADGRMGSI